MLSACEMRSYPAFHFVILTFREVYHVISLEESHFWTILNKNRTIDFESTTWFWIKGNKE